MCGDYPSMQAPLRAGGRKHVRGDAQWGPEGDGSAKVFINTAITYLMEA